MILLFRKYTFYMALMVNWLKSHSFLYLNLDSSGKVIMLGVHMCIYIVCVYRSKI